MNIGRRIADLRGEKSQRDVARDGGIDVSTVSRIERGEIDPTFSTLEKIAKGLNCSIEEIFGKMSIPRQGAPSEEIKGRDRWESQSMGPFRQQLGAQVKQAREQAGLDQIKLAAKIGVPTGTIAQIEDGATLPDFQTILALAATFQVPLHALTGRHLEKEIDDLRADNEEGVESIEYLTAALSSVVAALGARGINVELPQAPPRLRQGPGHSGDDA